jgi:DNA-binding Xre family transcriptional regulator
MAQVRSNLKQLIDDKGISIRQVSRDIDYRFDSVRQMYNDEMKQFPRDLLTKLCYYFNCHIKDLLTLDDGTKLMDVEVEKEPKG